MSTSMCSLVLALAFVSQGQRVPPPASDRLSARELLDRWAAGADLIESYSLSLELTSNPLVDNKDGKWRLLPEREAIKFPARYSRIYRKGGKRRGEFQRDEHGHYSPPMIWNGNTGYLFQPDGTSVHFTPFIMWFGSEQYEDYEATYRMFGGSIDRIQLSRERNTKSLPREGKLHVLDVPATPKPTSYNNLHWRVWLDPDRNFMPVRRMEWFQKTVGEALSLDVRNDLREVAAGVWAPIRTVTRVYHSGETSPLYGKHIGTNELRVIEDQSRFNVDVPDSLFEVKIPDGMTVTDAARNAVYTQGSADPDKYLAQLAKDENRKLDSLSPADRSPPAMVFIPPDEKPRWFWPLLIGIAVASAAGAIYAARRRWAVKGA